jgi:hypothetical protein
MLTRIRPILSKTIKQINTIPKYNVNKIQMRTMCNFFDNHEYTVERYNIRKERYDAVANGDMTHYDHRKEYNVTDVWPYMCSEFLDNIPKDTILYKSRNSDNKSENLSMGDGLQNIIMLDCLMFNKFFKVRWDDIERVLSYCKYKVEPHSIYGSHVQIDGWHYVTKGFTTGVKNEKYYEVHYDDSNLSEMSFPKNSREKLEIAKYLVQIMNEIDPKDRNKHNYHMIHEWEMLNNMNIQMENINYEQNERYLKEAKKTVDIKDLIIDNSDKKMLNNELLNILYTHAKEGGHDQYLLARNSDKAKSVNYDSVNYDGHVGVVNDAIIDVDFSDKIDLSGYIAINGDYRTQHVIDSFNGRTKHRYNCEEFTLGEVFAEMYNSQGPTGLGVLEFDENTMTPEQAEKVLHDENYYIGYYKGVRMKTRFSQFPIMDYHRYDDSCSDGAFMKCINRLHENKQTERDNLDANHVLNELDRIGADGQARSEILDRINHHIK